MGRHRNRNQKHKSKQAAECTSDEQPKDRYAGPKHYKDLVKDNVLLSKYYKGLEFIPADQWEEFYQTLKAPLPVTFRINGNRSQAKELLDVIQGQYLKKMTTEEVDGEIIQPPKQIEWYPDKVAWFMNVSRGAMRKAVTYSKFHQFLIAETESGNISRQEAVSMIPPLLLDVKPHHKVLDMCAAPGSKTAQLIELLHSDEKQKVPDGFVVANDADNKRCYLMVHQVKRLQTPCCMIVNHDASAFPKFRSNPDVENGKPEFYQFDRILADVPCSGDGTLRKNPDLWKRWNPTHACGLHGLQKKILKRGLELLTVGGRLVYSTCSFHPVEDEAPIAHILRKCAGSVELVDVKDVLPGLKSVPGLHTWKVMSKDGTWYENFEDLPAKLTNQLRQSVFPPTPEEAQSMHLERCLRILPHHQNTGGFFIAVLQKTQVLPWQKPRDDTNVANTVDTIGEDITDSKGTDDTTDKVTDKATDEVTDKDTDEVTDTAIDELTDDKKRKPMEEAGNRQVKKPRLYGYKEDPFLFTKSDEPFWSSVREFYKISDAFPCDQGMYRSEEGKRRSLYFVSAAIKNIVECNRNRVKFVNMGVKLFSRAPSPLVPQCEYRVAQECLASLHQEFTGRHVYISKQDACIILTEENPLIETLTTETAKYLNSICAGSVVFCYKPKDSDSHPLCEIGFCGWRGKVSVRSFIGEHERQHNLMLFGMDLDEIKEKVAKLKEDRKAISLLTVVQPKEKGDAANKMDTDTKEKMDSSADKIEDSADKINESADKIDDSADKTEDSADKIDSGDKNGDGDTKGEQV